MEEPCGLRSRGLLPVGHDWATSLSIFTSCIGEGNGNPLQCSCLENPRVRGAWWAAMSGIAQSRTRLKRLSSSSRTAAYQAPPSIGFSRQEYWSGLLLPSPAFILETLWGKALKTRGLPFIYLHCQWIHWTNNPRAPFPKSFVNNKTWYVEFLCLHLSVKWFRTWMRKRRALLLVSWNLDPRKGAALSDFRI